MTNQIVTTNASDVIESVVIGGDLSKLTTEQRLSYYRSVCSSMGLNPLTKPFDYITLNGKLTLYARKDAADQLRKLHDVSIIKLERERIDSIYTVTAYAQDKTGRQDSSIGAVNIENLKGDALANAIMKAETKAKRRVTLSICGLGMLDETELETIKEYTDESDQPRLKKAPHADQVQEQLDTIRTIEANKPVIPTNGEMSLEEAIAFIDSDGILYGTLATEKLAYKYNSMNKKMRKGEYNSEEQDKHIAEMKAIKLILDSRAIPTS